MGNLEMEEEMIDEAVWKEFEDWCHAQWLCMPVGKALVEHFVEWTNKRQIKITWKKETDAR
jgi:hypothetical protein